LYPIIPVDPTDIYVVTNETDTLDNLAFKYYKNPSLWWVLAQANNIGKGKLSVPAGIQLRVPTKLSTILNNYKSLNS
jgi:nucleoid-associated protein YgaU